MRRDIDGDLDGDISVISREKLGIDGFLIQCHMDQGTCGLLRPRS